MVFLNLQIQDIANGLIAAGYSLGDLPAEALVAVDATAPTSPNAGQLWLSTVDNSLSIYNGVDWQVLGLTSEQVTTLATLAGNVYTATQVDALIATTNASIATKQNTLVSGDNIKTINGTSILGSGNVLITTPMGYLNDLQDVTTTAPTTGQVLSYSGTEWVNTTPVAGITDHAQLTSIGTNTHSQIDTALTRLANTSGTNTGDQDLSGYSLTTHNHTGVYEPADATILKSADLGSVVQPYSNKIAFFNANQTWESAQRGAVQTITYGATITPDFTYQNFVCTLTGNVIVANPTNMVVGQSGEIDLIQDATGGRTTAWGTYYKWVGGTAPTYVTTANSKSTFAYSVKSSTEIILVPLVDWK